MRSEQRPSALLQKDELRGGGYYEFCPGEARGAHWGPESVYLTPEVFERVDAVFSRHAPHFNPYGPTVLRRVMLEPIIQDMQELIKERGDTWAVAETTGLWELAGWLTREMRKHACVTVLGP